MPLFEAQKLIRVMTGSVPEFIFLFVEFDWELHSTENFSSYVFLLLLRILSRKSAPARLTLREFHTHSHHLSLSLSLSPFLAQILRLLILVFSAARNATDRLKFYPGKI